MNNNTSYFSACLTVADLKKLYRQLVRQYHPDLCGDDEVKTAEFTKIMQTINAEYHAKLQHMDGQKSTGTDDKEHTYHYHEETEQAVMDKLAELIGLNLPDDVEIYLIGTWIWVKGETKPHAKLLGKKGAGLRFVRTRSAWSFHVGTWRRGSSSSDLDELGAKYGSTKFKNGRANSNRRTAPQLSA